MRRRHPVAIAAAIAMMFALTPASAAPVPPDHQSANLAEHADRLGTGISASLEGRLRAAQAQEQLEVIVTWNGRPDVAAAQRAAGPFTIIREFTLIDGFLATVNPGQARALARVPGVFRVEDNFEVRANNEETDVEYGTERGRAEYGVDGSGVSVCVLDTGADPNHEQLDSRIVAFHDSINGLTTAYDDHNHGTHVAATIAGDGVGSSTNAAKYQGIAPGASLYIAKVLSGQGTGTTAQIIDGLEWCVAQGVDIVSASLGGGASDGLDALSQAFNNAVLDHGVVATVAAGNSGDGPETVGAPGAGEHVLTVGASSKFKDGLRLAPFSSRGPNLAGVMKPDIVSPGVFVTSAQANTTSGYLTASGTSMATPFTAGAVALALAVDPTLTPSEVKTLMTSTAHDVGVPGHDTDWGAGLIDGYGFLSAAAGGNANGSFPTHTYVTGSVANNGLWTHNITIDGDDVGQPLGITLLIDGEMVCTLELFGICFIAEWSPDLDARLIAPNGTITNSRCPLEGDCGTAGVQETFYTASAQAGEYQLEVYPFADPPNNGLGGPFGIDIFTGSASDTEPPVNQDPVADAGPNQTVPDSDGSPGETVSLDGSGSTDPDGTIASWEWSEGATSLGSGETLDVALGDGLHNITLTVTDDQGATDTDIVTVTVEAPPPPPNEDPVADAGPDQTVPDSDGSPGETVSLDASGSTDPDGTIASWEWSEGATSLGSGETLDVALGDGLHNITLTVTDDQGATDTDIVTVTVEAPPPPPGPNVHIGDLDAGTNSLPKGRWNATVIVIVHDDDETPVVGATVSFSLSTGQNRSCVTIALGQCSVTSPEYKNRTKNVTFTVTNVVGSDPYDAGDNHDPDSDSNGTTIVINRP